VDAFSVRIFEKAVAIHTAVSRMMAQRGSIQNIPPAGWCRRPAEALYLRQNLRWTRNRL